MTRATSSSAPTAAPRRGSPPPGRAAALGGESRSPRTSGSWPGSSRASGATGRSGPRRRFWLAAAAAALFFFFAGLAHESERARPPTAEESYADARRRPERAARDLDPATERMRGIRSPGNRIDSPGAPAPHDRRRVPRPAPDRDPGGDPARADDRLPAFVAGELARRQHGYGRGGRMKIEKDAAVFEGGVRGGVTLGSPIAIGIAQLATSPTGRRSWARSRSIRRRPRERRLTRPRPGHADLAGGMKFGATDLRDVLERASARESVARVAAGAVCKLLLRECGIAIRSGVLSARRRRRHASRRAPSRPSRASARTRRCAPSTPPSSRRWSAAVDAAKRDGETLGGSILVGARGVPAGLGSYVAWDRKLDGRIGQALLSVPAVKAVEFGSAIEASRGPGSAAHDEIEPGPRRGAAPAHQPRRRPRGRRDQRRGHRRGGVHEADLDARPRPRLRRPRDGRGRARPPTSAATSPRFRPAA